MSDTTAVDTLVTEAGIQSYVQNTAFESHAVDKLSGGTANFTYRIHLLEPIDGKSTFIVKYAAPYIASSANTTRMPFSPERQKVEVEALRLAHRLSRSDEHNAITVPRVHLFDEEAHVIIMDDVGEDVVTLKELLINESVPVDILEEMGSALGQFLGHLHGWHERPDVDLSLFAHNELGKTISIYATYSRVVSTLTGKHGIPALSDPLLDVPEEKLETISRVVETRTKEIHASTPSDFMTHGDFWTGNVVVLPRRGADGAIEGLGKMYVLDWELAKTGLPGLDLGQMCAELHLISRFHPHRKDSANTVMQSLLSVYRRTRPTDSALTRVAVSHLGAHLVVWPPRVAWGGRERTREVVQEGVDLLELGWTGSEPSLRESIVGTLMSE
ncbi:hypothetical protein ID866_5181 [Astraeus odoratus]|nr:hypothetical protein ID866_5181 [Astraeus odoratus]